MGARKYTYDEYTYEDYIRDFELDYLGFDGIPDEAVPGVSPSKVTENESGQEADDHDGNGHAPGLRLQK